MDAKLVHTFRIGTQDFVGLQRLYTTLSVLTLKVKVNIGFKGSF